MSNEILVNVTPYETRVATVEQGVLQDLHIQRGHRGSILGNIYKGRVERVVPGMQAAFVNIGLDRTAFLHVADLARGDDNDADIGSVLRNGDSILVQVIKEPLGSKGARLTGQITIPSRYLVHLPYSVHVGISARIEDEAERERLRDQVGRLASDSEATGGFIVRTAGEQATAEDIANDMAYLQKCWSDVRRKASSGVPGTLIHSDLPLVTRVVRDLVEAKVERIRIDDPRAFAQCEAFARDYVPWVAPRLELYDADTPIFDLYGVEDELQRALERRVTLKSGGHLVFDQTESMTTVDVNTGAYLGYRNLEETIFKTNLEAAHAIAHQLRLRNLGGIIIIDFIDMNEETHREQVLAALEKAVARDRAKTTISQISPLGLVEMTRKRTRESLERILCEPCRVCNHRGTVKTPDTVMYEIFRELRRTARQFDSREYRVLASPEVIERLREEQAGALAEMQEFLHTPIRLQAESQYQSESFDVVPL